MKNTINTPKLLFRDGTSQQNREMEALKPGYIPVEERSMEELIAEVQRLAQEIHFFNINNQPENTWEYFLVEDPEAYQKASPEEKKGLREQWAVQLASYVDNPESFISDKKKFARLSQPHTVLFITFLRLLNHVKSKINGLTQKHLNFYFQERLGLTPKEAVPDIVNVLLELTENIDKLEVKKGTIFLAGKDKDGNELHYKTNEDAVISKAKITQLKNVFVDKQLITVKVAHQNNRNTPDKGLLSMMQIALGDPNPGDELPAFPDGINNLLELNDALGSGDNTAAISYIEKHLFLSEESFQLIMRKYLDDKQGISTDWKEVYTMLDEAYKRKFKFNRKQELKNLHDNNGFEELMKHMFGNPNPGNSLPPYHGTTASLTRIFEDLGSDDANTKREALDYVEDELKLSDLDFMHVMQTSNNTDTSDEDWEKFYRILELANRQVRSLTLPAPYIEKINDVFAQHDAKETSFSLHGDEEESKRFKTFGGRQQGQNQSLQPANLGFAISSPTLLLREGKRHITTIIDLGIASNEINFLKPILENDFPFLVRLSSAKEWWQPKNISVEVGNFLGTESEGECNFSFDQESLTVSNTDDIVPTDEGKFLVFSNGIIYKIEKFISPDEIKIIQVGDTNNTYTTNQKYDSSQVYINSLKISIDLDEDNMPVESFINKKDAKIIQANQPTLLFTLNHHNDDKINNNESASYYQALMNLGLKK
ncbi:MAG: hypothetical protein MI922_22905, partial [Bacteroidales bacterium]|nr:hypothetical protein [Bacteroidales bacterium]